LLILSTYDVDFSVKNAYPELTALGFHRFDVAKTLLNAFEILKFDY